MRLGLLIFLLASQVFAQTAKDQLRVGATYFAASTLNVRNHSQIVQSSVVGQLQMNDQVEVLDLMDSSTELVKVSIIKSRTADNSLAADLFVSFKFLSSTPKADAVLSGAPSKYFVVQNIATERTRVYERCTSSPGCGHRMIFETPILVGLPKDDESRANQYGLRTQVGSFRISAWKKFYMDGGNKYAPWWAPDFPKLPRVGASLFDWYDKKILPKGSKYEARGAFGWYAAHLNPSPEGQWMHGTFGWGADKDKFIDKYIEDGSGAYQNMSSGCTRLENRGIAYLRHLLPEGTEVYRVYAREAVRDQTLSRYESQKSRPVWNWILTNEGVNSEGPTSDAATVLSRNVPVENILEKGSYEIDQYPDGIGLWGGTSEKTRQRFVTGNVYGIKSEDFRGVFLVDEGQFVDYAHPDTDKVIVHSSRGIPLDLKTSSTYTLAKPYKRAQ